MRARVVRSAIFLVLGQFLLRASAPGRAQPVPRRETYAPPDFIVEPAQLPPGWEERGVWRLQLGEALRRSVENNLDIVLQREEVRIADAGIEVALGVFEPTLSASYRHSNFDLPPVTSFEGGAQELASPIADEWNISVDKRLPTGTQLSLAFLNSRSRSDPGMGVQPPSYLSTFRVGLTQPLLRGFSFDLAMPRVELLRAEFVSETERDELAVQMMEVVQRTESAYWDVVQALKSYRVQSDSLGRARDQLELSRRQIAAGTLAPSDRLSAESTLAQRQLGLVRAEAAIEVAWDRLRQELNLPRTEWRRAILPLDSPIFEPMSVSDEEALRLALANRPEIRQQDGEVAAAALEVRKAENDRLPQIDLGLTYEVNGQHDAYGGALDQLADRNAPGWTAMATLSWTPMLRAAGAAVDIQRARERAARTRKDQLVLGLFGGVRGAVRDLATAARQVQAAARFRELAERSLDAEQRKFMTGTSSNFLVAQRQEEVALAQIEELDALLGHKKAELALERQTGRLLEARGIVLPARRSTGRHEASPRRDNARHGVTTRSEAPRSGPDEPHARPDTFPRPAPRSSKLPARARSTRS